VGDQPWLWTLGDRIASERIATLSYDGHIQAVAEITGRTRYDVGAEAKWALSGDVLRPGDPVHDGLKGSPAPRHRNPVSYFDTSFDRAAAVRRMTASKNARQAVITRPGTARRMPAPPSRPSCPA
jgi:hypothetical protein